MTKSRRLTVDESKSGTYHVISRCVRGAYLCGDQAEHRRGWLEDGIRTFSQVFSVDVLTFSIMSNHFHLVLRTDPEQAKDWSAREVVRRWAIVCPRTNHRTGEVEPLSEDEIDSFACRPEWVAKKRSYLASMSWFMRLLKQRIAIRANKEDKTTGHFWEGRFKSIPLLDSAAIIACMAYVDLNPIRAKMATTPENSAHTGIQLRAKAQRLAATSTLATQIQDGGTAASASLITNDSQPKAEQFAVKIASEPALWIAPCLQATCGQLSTKEYLQLVDQTGRHLAAGKRGAIPTELAPILDRLAIDHDNWFETMKEPKNFLGTAVGTIAQLAAEAKRLGLKWIANKTGLHQPRRSFAPASD